MNGGSPNFHTLSWIAAEQGLAFVLVWTTDGFAVDNLSTKTLREDNYCLLI